MTDPAPPAAQPSPAFTLVSEEVLHRGRVVTVTDAVFSTPRGDLVHREIVRHPGAVAVVPVVDGDVLLVRQFRAAMGADVLEIPAGKRDVAGEPLEVTAARELAEEIGREAGELVLLTTIVTAPGFCDETLAIFLATDLHEVPHEPHGVEEEYMTVERWPLDDAIRHLLASGLVDAKTLAGLYAAREHLAGS